MPARARARRYTLILFTQQSYGLLPREDRAYLLELGFPLPPRPPRDAFGYVHMPSNEGRYPPQRVRMAAGRKAFARFRQVVIERAAAAAAGGAAAAAGEGAAEATGEGGGA